MKFFVEAMGAKQVATRFERMGADALDASPAFATIAEMLFAITAKTFESQGRRGGGSWKRLSQDWRDRKMREELDPRIGFATGRLFKSVTSPDAEGQVLIIRPQYLRFGSDLPQAEPQQRNRPFIKLRIEDKNEMRRVLRNHLMRVWRGRRR